MGDSVRTRTVSQRLEHGEDAGSVARELVLDFLADHNTTDELRHNAALVAYELVANAVAHGNPYGDGAIELSCELDDNALIVRVRDAGSHGSVEPRALKPEVGHGRGLAIVDALSSSWTVDRSDGTVVTAQVPLTWPTAEGA
jgi:anti-sigma regulatory factor (Ser/Thr protein kinase)